MKIRYIIASILACAFMAAGCTEEQVSSLSGIKVSNSYIGLPTEGGNATITLTASVDWSFDQTLIPEWLTIEPLSGNAGEYTVTFSAGETYSNNEAELKINAGEEVQYLIVNQPADLSSVEYSTVQEVLNGQDGTIYFVEGTVTSIENTTYGNWYLVDETGSLYIYGTLDANGAEKNFSSLGIAEGDRIKIHGPRSTHNSTVELVNVTVDELIKSLVKVDQNEYTLEKEAGEFTVNVSVSGNNLDVKTDADWIRLVGISGSGESTVATISYDENTGYAPREAVLKLSSSNGSSTSEIEVTVRQNGNVPATSSIADAIAGQGEYFSVEGTVSAVCTQGFVLTDATASVLVYFGKDYDNAYSVGDKVQVAGEMGSYNYGPQFDSPDYVGMLEEGGDFEYPAAEELTGTDMDELIETYVDSGNMLDIRYVKVTGQISISGSHYNFTVDGASSSTGSIYNPVEELGIADMNGQTKTVYGYMTSISGGKYVNLVVTSVE
ncbi:MAG: hypothetical protein IAC08_08050 [Bacteroidetes bacterium]|uniref:BACON domain-containing protein n=1 Tax=Candidatus Cryptobacteroides intestinigallinarum TaxID=2840767 RepID=A0A9D9N151_9BACT|nr:hypothetical protein [Candidatus Cryptobacteroides intestinigallinarum]